MGRVYDALKRAESTEHDYFRKRDYLSEGPMKAFISWSGDRSLAIAKALRDWLPRVIQAIEPWMSESDIEKGSRWEQIIGQELSETKFGIICLTPENLDSRWINFEAGAISKTVEKTYVCTYLLNLRPADIEGPLAQFNHTRVDKEDTRRLVHTINRSLTRKALAEKIVDEAFDAFWPGFEARISDLPSAEPTPEPSRSVNDMVGEILELVRSQSGRNELRLGAKLRPRLMSTLDWTPEDAQLLTDYYLAVKRSAILEGAITDPVMFEFLDRLQTDRGFAANFLNSLKQLPPEKLERILKDTVDENENSNP